MLPENNNKYILQIVCLFFSVMCLMKDFRQFTMVSVLLYLFPIILDLWTVELEPTWLDYLRIVCAIFDSVICVIFVGGVFTGLLIDSGTSFTVIDTSMILAEYPVSKKFLLWVALGNLTIPIMFLTGTPNRGTMETVMKVRELERR